MNYEFLNTSFFTYDSDEIDDIFPSIKIINAKSTFYGDWNVNSLNHFLANSGHQFWIKHELSAETPIDGFVTWAAAVEIDFVVTPLLYYFRRSCTFDWILSAYLAYNWMLFWSKIE